VRRPEVRLFKTPPLQGRHPASGARIAGAVRSCTPIARAADTFKVQQGHGGKAMRLALIVLIVVACALSVRANAENWRAVGELLPSTMANLEAVSSTTSAG
jgi:hypothetical protein